MAQGRVVDCLRQLEVLGDSRVGVPTQGIARTTPEQEDEQEQQQERPTSEEICLVEELSAMMPIPGTDPACGWVFRRMDYTEYLNPNHDGFVLAGTGGIVGHFHCSALEPTSLEILH